MYKFFCINSFEFYLNILNKSALCLVVYPCLKNLPKFTIRVGIYSYHLLKENQKIFFQFFINQNLHRLIR